MAVPRDWGRGLERATEAHRLANTPTLPDPAHTLTAIRGAVLRALPVDPVAEAEFEAWLHTHETPKRLRKLQRKARVDRV